MDEDEYAEREALRQGIRRALARIAESQMAISRRLGVSTQTIRQWSAGVTVPSEANLARLARLSNMTQEQIRTGAAID